MTRPVARGIGVRLNPGSGVDPSNKGRKAKGRAPINRPKRATID